MGIPKFRVNYLYCEYLEDKMRVGQNPLPLLISRSIKSPEEKAQFIAKYLDGIDFDVNEEHFDYVNKRYPESKTDTRGRAQYFSDRIVEQYGYLNTECKRVFHLVVSHGTPIKMFSQLNAGRKKKVKFCGLSAIAIAPISTYGG
jgi:hypothetical protein